MMPLNLRSSGDPLNWSAVNGGGCVSVGSASERIGGLLFGLVALFVVYLTVVGSP
jgi:hypothetical protein